MTTDDTRYQKAAAARAAALKDRAARQISALEIERAGYVMRDLPDRVAQVDEQIEYWRSQAPTDPATGAPAPRAKKARGSIKARAGSAVKPAPTTDQDATGTPDGQGSAPATVTGVEGS